MLLPRKAESRRSRHCRDLRSLPCWRGRGSGTQHGTRPQDDVQDHVRTYPCRNAFTRWSALWQRMDGRLYSGSGLNAGRPRRCHVSSLPHLIETCPFRRAEGGAAQLEPPNAQRKLDFRCVSCNRFKEHPTSGKHSNSGETFELRLRSASMVP